MGGMDPNQNPSQNPYPYSYSYPYTWPPQQPPARTGNRPVVIAAVIAGVAGLVVGAVLAGVVVFAVGAFGAFGAFNPDPLTRGPGGALPSFQLLVGQCANGEVAPGESFGSDSAIPCERLHDLEVYASTAAPGQAPGDRYPGADDLALYAEDYCLLAMEAFVGQTYEDSDFDYAGIVPSRAAWQQGDRAVVCALWRYDGEPTIGSARVEA
jgi:hypothetical protein